MPPDAPSSGFPPIADPHIHTLILGSLPSVASLAKQQYYGHPRNAFWPIMGRLLDAGPELDYDQRVKILLASGTGVWDVLASSIRPGSLDANIDLTSAQLNNFEKFWDTHKHVVRVLFNGRKAAQLFRTYVNLRKSRRESIELLDMPSTSPAHAVMTFDKKLAAWSIVSARPAAAIQPME